MDQQQLDDFLRSLTAREQFIWNILVRAAQSIRYPGRKCCMGT